MRELAALTNVWAGDWHRLRADQGTLLTAPSGVTNHVVQHLGRGIDFSRSNDNSWIYAHRSMLRTSMSSVLSLVPGPPVGHQPADDFPLPRQRLPKGHKPCGPGKPPQYRGKPCIPASAREGIRRGAGVRLEALAWILTRAQFQTEWDEVIACQFAWMYWLKRRSDQFQRAVMRRADKRRPKSR